MLWRRRAGVETALRSPALPLPQGSSAGMTALLQPLPTGEDRALEGLSSASAFSLQQQDHKQGMWVLCYAVYRPGKGPFLGLRVPKPVWWVLNLAVRQWEAHWALPFTVSALSMIRLIFCLHLLSLVPGLSFSSEHKWKSRLSLLEHLQIPQSSILWVYWHSLFDSGNPPSLFLSLSDKKFIVRDNGCFGFKNYFKISDDLEDTHKGILILHFLLPFSIVQRKTVAIYSSNLDLLKLRWIKNPVPLHTSNISSSQ